MKSVSENKVIGVVVSFCPDQEVLISLLSSLAKQVFKVIIVDNTPAGSVGISGIMEQKNLINVEIISLGENFGVAKALNIGIERAVSLRATHLLLSDQDSLPGAGMVEGLLKAYDELSLLGIKIGAVGPIFLNGVVKESYKFQVQGPNGRGYKIVAPSDSAPHVDTLSLITSGLLIPVSVLHDAGLMREDFFIDHVDVEWAHRVRAKGYHLFGTAYASMLHQMGDSSLRVWVFGWRVISGYGPTRLYYRFRNFVYILRLDYVPRWWKWRASWFWMGEAYAHIFFSERRLLSLSSIARGCWDGFRGKLGVRIFR